MVKLSFNSGAKMKTFQETKQKAFATSNMSVEEIGKEKFRQKFILIARTKM
jgi:hypothetical protein